jgi:urease accessory protein UreE
MALIEKQIVDLVELVQSNHIQVRTANIIEKDGTEIARTLHRHVLSPGDSIVNEDPKVQAIANAVWTEEVIAAYQASLVQENN